MSRQHVDSTSIFPVFHTMWQSIAAVVSHATLWDWLLLSVGGLLVLYIAGTWNYDYFQKRGIPSTKPKIPFVGDMLETFMGRRSFTDITREQYELCKNHGVFGFFVFTEPSLFITDPELLKVVAVKEFDSFMNHRQIQSENTDPIFGRNIFNLRDQHWRDIRATLSPAFTSSKIKGMFPLISQCGEQLVQHVRQKYAKSKEGTSGEPLVIDMKNLCTRMANDVIASAAFGVSCDSLKNSETEFYTMGKRLTTFSKLRIFIFLCYIVVPKFMEVLRLRVLDANATNFFKSLLHETIQERQKNNIFRPDVLQLLMQAREGKLKVDKEDEDEAEDVGTGKKLDYEDIEAQVILFFFAGFETVSTAVCLASHLLSHHRDEQRRLQAEIAEVMESTGGKLTYEAVQSMKYLDAVVNETLRMYPPTPGTDRMCRKDTVLPATGRLGPITVRKGQNINIPFVGLHYDPKYWEEPNRFNPDRFSNENKHKIKPFTYMPFGVGPRICIGQRFALMEVKLSLVHLLFNFDLHPSTKTKQPLEFEPGLNLIALGGFWCGLTPREG